MIVQLVSLLLMMSTLWVDARGRERKVAQVSCYKGVDNDLDETFRMMTHIGASTSLIKSNTRRYMLLAGEKHCREEHDPTYRRLGLETHLVSSTCPGYLMLNYDTNRIPDTIVEVRCACKRCLEMSTGNTCMAVKYTRQVLVKKGKGCVKAFESFSVGCTCRKSDNATAVLDNPKSPSG